MPSFPINFFSASGILITITYLPLFLLILTQGKTLLAKIYSLHILSVFIWGLGTIFIGFLKDQQMAEIALKFAYSGVLLIPVFLCHSVILMTQRRSKRILLAAIYGQAAYFLYQNWNDTLFKVEKIFDSFYYYQGEGVFLQSFLIWAALVSLAHIMLIGYYRRGYNKERVQIRFLCFAIISFLGGITNFLPAIGIIIYPYGNILIPVYLPIITYAILKHQLLDIKIVIKKSLLYTFSISAIFLFYLLVIVIVEKALQTLMGYNSTGLSILIAFLLGLIFTPIRAKIQNALDRVFFRRTPIQMAEENELLRQKAIEANKLKSVAILASGMAHEVKNPMTAMRTFAEYIPQRIDDKHFLVRSATLMKDEIDRIDNLVNQLLEFSRPAAPHFKPLILRGILENTLEFLSSKLLKHNIHLITDLKEQRPIIADTNQLRQVFLNILLNAIEVMKSGGTLTVQSQLKKNFFAGNSAPILEIQVQDTGPGIAPGSLSYIFDPFFSEKDTKSGLGLAIVERILKDHAGKILVRSQRGKGTTFILQFPTISEEERPEI